jgi:hypothetical protein
MRFFCAYALLLALATSARSGPVTVAFTGTVDRSDSGLIGDPVSGSFTYDPSAPNANGNDPTNGLYNETTPFHLNLAGHTFTNSQDPESYQIQTFSPLNNSPPPTYAITLYVVDPLLNGQPTDDPTGRVELSFQDATGQLLALGPDLPSVWDTSEFTSLGGAVLGFGDLGFGIVHFSIDTLAIIPEPGSITLAALGLVVASAVRWRERATRRSRLNAACAV